MVRFWARGRASGGGGRTRATRSRRWTGWESLEKRLLMATVGADYVLAGSQWSNPSHITYSIAPDGVLWDHGTNLLNGSFNTLFGGPIWQSQIAKALATWEASANINISQVPDTFQGLDVPGQAQGDPRFGDIRFGGYNFLNDTTTLAQTYFPPPNGWTASGDVEVNTAMNFNINTSYDLYSVLLHETGHSLGLDHPTNPAEVMYPIYQGVRSGLAPGDIAGIQSLYGARVPDVFQRQGLALGPANPLEVTGGLSASNQLTLGNVSLPTIGATEWFSVVAPATGGTLQATAAASGLSLLSPKVGVFDAFGSGVPLDVQGNPSAWGDNVSAHVGNVVPGQRYYILVTGATNDVFAVGAYQLQVAFTGSSPIGISNPPPPPPAPPVVPPAPPIVGPPIAPDRFEPNNTFAQATPLGAITQTVVGNLTLDTASNVDVFSFLDARAGIYQVNAFGTNIQIFDSFGHQVTSGSGQVRIQVYQPLAKLYVVITPQNHAPVADYGIMISLQPGSTPTPPAIGTRKGRPPVHHQVASAAETTAPVAWPRNPFGLTRTSR